MKWKNINVPLGVSETPIGTSRCSVAAELIGSLFGTVGNYAAAVNTAQENRWAQEEANESNERINQEQLAWARENYELEKEENRFLVDQAYQRELENRKHNEWYNSPAQELQRLRAAGLNPYLAKYGNGAAGSVSGHSIGAQVGSPARHNQPNMIPMQASHELPFNGWGQGINDAMKIALQSKELAQKERVFEHDVSVQENKMEMEWFDYLDRHAKSGAEVREINERIDNMRKTFAFEQNKFEKQVEWQNFQQYVQQYQLEQRDFEMSLQQLSIESGVQVNSAMASKLFAEKKNFEESARQMVKNGFSQRLVNYAMERKENAIADALIQDYEQEHGQIEFENRNKVFKAYKRVANAVLQPIRGVVSAGANVATKVK